MRRISLTIGILAFLISLGVLEFFVSPRMLSSLSTRQIQKEGWNLTADILHEPRLTDTSEVRVTKRLQQRIYARYQRYYSINELKDALVVRSALLHRRLQISFQSSDGTAFDPWSFTISANPLWIRADLGDTFSYKLNEAAIAKSFSEKIAGEFPLPIDSTVSVVASDGDMLRVTTDHPAEAGYVFDSDVVKTIRNSLLGSDDTLSLPVTYTPGRILNTTGRDLGKLKLLSSGRSNFAGSGDGRISNVRKGLSDFVNDVLVPPGAVVSFNDMVHYMSSADGWEDALVIMNGTDLKPFPGGGICQVATTTYRAALLAGLPIIDRANHSLYVSYYEKYGVGIDATIFPHQQDLTFRNDTGNFILIEAYSRGFEAFVNFYGTSDGRSTTLEGPFFSSNVTSEVDTLLPHPLADNEIAWVRHLQFSDGSKKDEPILSRYLSIPRKLPQQYAKSMLLSSLIHE